MVDAVVEHVSLRCDEGDLSFDMQLASHLEETDDALVMFIARANSAKAEREIAIQLSHRLGMDWFRVEMYMRGSHEDLEDVLQKDGIALTTAILPLEDDDTYTFVQSGAQATHTDSGVHISSIAPHVSQPTGGRRSRREKGSFRSTLQTDSAVPSSSSPASQPRAPLPDLEDAMNTLEEQLGSLSLSADAVYTADSLPSQRMEPTAIDDLATQCVRPSQAPGERPASVLALPRESPRQLDDGEAEGDAGSRSSAARGATYVQPRAVTTAASAMASLVASLMSSTSVFGGNDEYTKVNGILGERYVSVIRVFMCLQSLIELCLMIGICCAEENPGAGFWT